MSEDMRVSQHPYGPSRLDRCFAPRNLVGLYYCFEFIYSRWPFGGGKGVCFLLKTQQKFFAVSRYLVAVHADCEKC